MKSVDSTNPNPPNRSDGMFIATLGVVGGTYVLLILALLAGDLVYLFTAPSSEDVSLTFDHDESGSAALSAIRRKLSDFGLTVDSNRELLLFDSTRSGKNPWGTPHSDFGGPGTGVANSLSSSIRNDKPLGNLLTAGPIDADQPGALSFRWAQPVTVGSIDLLAGEEAIEVEYLLDTESVHKHMTAQGDGPGTIHRVPGDGVKADAVTISFSDGGGVAALNFSWAGRIQAPWELKLPWLSAVIHNPITTAFSKPEIRYSIALSLISCTATAIISLWIAIPLGYLLSRFNFFGKGLIDSVLDIPIILPPLVVGLSLLILFQFAPVTVRDAVVYQIPAVILAQVAVACAFAVRTMKAAFDQIDPRCERVALTLGCGRASAFSRVVLPEAVPGILTAGTLAWARALGEFGPLLIFAGATRFKTEVLSTSVFLELSVGDLGAAVAISMIMVIAAVAILILTRIWGTKTISL